MATLTLVVIFKFPRAYPGYKFITFGFKVPSEYPLLQETAIQPELHGNPIVLQVPTDATNKELYSIVEKSIARLHQLSDQPEFHECCRRTADSLVHSETSCDASTRICSAQHFRQGDRLECISDILCTSLKENYRCR